METGPEQNEDELWREYRKTKNKRIREILCKQYGPLVKWVAGKVAQGMPKNVEFDDLVSCGTFGLLDAIEKFDPDKGVKFKTYAATRIRGAIFDELRASDWVPRSVRQQIKEFEEAMSHLESELGRTPTDVEIAAYLKIDSAEYTKRMLKMSNIQIVSLEENWHSGDDTEKISIGDAVQAPKTYNPDVIAERNEIIRIVFNVIQELPEKEKQVMILYHYEDLTLKDIGRIMGITESRVSQLHTKAMLRIRVKLTNARKGIT
jgi:RNA polymerase sigma factor for flagellar operon FliA